MEYILSRFLNMSLMVLTSLAFSFQTPEVSMIINEIGAYEKKDYEWIEVFNASDHETDMKDWSFWEQDVNHGLTLAQGEDSIVGVGEYALVVQNFGKFKELYPNVTSTIFDSSWASLNEEGEEIGLRDPEDNLAEHFVYMPAEEKSLERVEIFTDIYTEENWKKHPESNSAGFANYWAAQERAEDSTDIDFGEDFPEEQTGTQSVPESAEEAGTEFFNKTLVAQMELGATSTYVGVAVVFDASESYDNDGQILSYYWDFGDKSFSSSSLASHHYSATGTFMIELSVNDGYATNTASTSLKVEELFLGGKDENSNSDSEPQRSTDTLTSPLDPREYIFINEFVSYPNEGQTEWVELFNAASSSFQINGWRLRDGKGQIAFVSSTINGGAYILVELEKNVLNNSGDLIRLEDEKAVLVDQVAYGDWENEIGLTKMFSIPRAYSLGRFGDYTGKVYGLNVFKLTSLTSPGALNYWSGKGEELQPTHQSSLDIGSNSGGAVQNPKGLENISKDTSYTKDTFVSSSKIIYKKGEIVISEIFPNPKGSDTSDEFIELYNLTDRSIDLSAWKLGDGSARRYAIDDVLLGPGEYRAFKRSETHISLNNTGAEEVLLFGPDAGLLDQVSYDGSHEGQAYMRNDRGTWFWTAEPSPGAGNILKNLDSVSSTASSTIQLKTQEEKSEEEFSFFVPDDFMFIEISEIFPNPSGLDDKEFIELYNRGSAAIDLAGLKLDDEEGGSRPYEFSDNTIIPAYSFRVFYKEETGLTLNNSFDSARLLLPGGEILQEIFFTDVIEGASFSRANNDAWDWTIILTPGAPNEIVFGNQTSPNTKAGLRSALPKSFAETQLGSLANYEAGDRIKVKGTVAVAPGVFGSQYFYMVDMGPLGSVSSSLGGVQVYMNKKDFPQLITGDYVQVAGELSDVRGEPRLKISAKEDIVKLDHVGLGSPGLLEISEIENRQLGGMIRVEGEITSLKSTYMFVDDGTGEIKVYFKKGTGVHGGNFQEGYKVSVIGLLAKDDSALQILPRSLDDIEVIDSMLKVDNSERDFSFIIKGNERLYLFIIFCSIALICGIIYLRRVKSKKIQ